jgi:hypothetical protein
MAGVEGSLIESLLWKSEGDDLDFKRDQYPFESASRDEKVDKADKAELLKDIVALANAWKTGDGYVLIGVDENPGGRARVVGVDQHLEDASVQQFVNAKVNRPIKFSYVPLQVEGKQVGLIVVGREQQRPICLTKNYGGLLADLVYMRHGSSTDVAKPDEIARMGSAAAYVEVQPVLAVELGDDRTRATFGAATTVTSRVLSSRPAAPPDPGLVDTAASRYLVDLSNFEVAFSQPKIRPVMPGYDPDPKKLREYNQEIGLLTRLGFCAKNTGPVVVLDARVVVQVAKCDGLRVVDRLPKRPRGTLAMVEAIRMREVFYRPERSTSVADLGATWELVARLGKIQPNATVWSEPFWLGGTEPCELQMVAHVYGDNIVPSMEVPISVTVVVEPGWLDPEGDDDHSSAEDDD